MITVILREQLVPSPTKRHRHAGFTLVETVATIVIMSIIALGASRVLREVMTRYTTAATQSALHDALSGAMERIVVELRTIGQRASTSPTAPDITTFTSNSIVFNAGTSREALNITSGHLVLETQVSGVTTSNILVDGSNRTLTLTIEAFDKDNTSLTLPLADTSTVRRIRVTLSATWNGVTETVRTKVYIRSMMSGSGSA